MSLKTSTTKQVESRKTHYFRCITLSSPYMLEIFIHQPGGGNTKLHMLKGLRGGPPSHFPCDSVKHTILI